MSAAAAITSASAGVIAIAVNSWAFGFPERFMNTLKVTQSPCLKAAIWFLCKKMSFVGKIWRSSGDLMNP